MSERMCGVHLSPEHCDGGTGCSSYREPPKEALGAEERLRILADLGQLAIDYPSHLHECAFCDMGDYDGDGGERHAPECPVAVAMLALGMDLP